MHVSYVKFQHMDDKSPLNGRGQAHLAHFKFLCSNDISETDEARIIKFCLQLDCTKS